MRQQIGEKHFLDIRPSCGALYFSLAKRVQSRDEEKDNQSIETYHRAGAFLGLGKNDTAGEYMPRIREHVLAFRDATAFRESTHLSFRTCQYFFQLSSDSKSHNSLELRQDKLVLR